MQYAKAKLFKALDQTKEAAKINSLISNIMIEEQNSIGCMGGEEKVQALKNKLSDINDANFKRLYEKLGKIYVLKALNC